MRLGWLRRRRAKERFFQRRHAWLDGHQNYLIGDASFTAIPIPAALSLAKKRDLDPIVATRPEEEALRSLCAYDRAPDSAADAFFTIAAYAGDQPLRFS